MMGIILAVISFSTKTIILWKTFQFLAWYYYDPKATCHDQNHTLSRLEGQVQFVGSNRMIVIPQTNINNAKIYTT